MQVEILKTIFSILGSIATAAAVVFAGMQFVEDRKVRVAQAKLDAIELLMPRYVFQARNPPIAVGSAVGNTLLNAKEASTVSFSMNVFNETGLSYRMFVPVYVCDAGAVHFATGAAARAVTVTTPPGHTAARLGGARPIFPNGGVNFDIKIMVNGVALNRPAFVDLMFLDISVPVSVSAPIAAALDGYVDAGFAQSLDAREVLTYTYLPENFGAVMDIASNMKEACGDNPFGAVETLREEIFTSAKRWEFLPRTRGSAW